MGQNAHSAQEFVFKGVSADWVLLNLILIRFGVFILCFLGQITRLQIIKEVKYKLL